MKVEGNVDVTRKKLRERMCRKYTKRNINRTCWATLIEKPNRVGLIERANREG